MRISSDWLNDFVTVPATDKLAHLFEMAGVGVENLQDDNFTLEVTSNRGDWLSATGLAREIAAMTGGRFRTPSDEIAPDSFAREYSQQPFRIAVENGEDCNRYTARVIENVKVAQSPQWLKDRLTQCGVRPINNVVDVTNFVMLETGQPLHAFDADAISGDTIFIRRARDGETLQTLDGVERVLNGEVLVIADTEKPLGLAGVMGGQSSEVTQTTRHVLLESAHFSPRRIRRGRNTLALSSEASRRFERYVDANNVRRASDRAAQLLHELASGEVAPVIADSYLRVLAPRAVQMRVARCNALLGLQLSIEQIEAIFARLGFASTRADEANLEVTIPTFRGDIEREVDLIEEVARLHGYDLIPRTLPKTVNAMAGRSLSQRLEERAKSALLRGGHSEVVTLSMQSRADVARAGQNENAPVVSLRNPLSEDFVQLRTSLLPSMLGVLARNAATLNELPTRAARIFELGRVYVPRENGAQPDERRRLAIAAMGAPPAPHWDKKAAAAPPDFFALKAVVESLLAELHTAPARWQAARADGFHPGRCAMLSLNGEDFGICGEVHPDVAANYDLPQRAVVALLDFETLVRHVNLLREYSPLPRFPAIDRDIALVVPQQTSAGKIENTLRAAGGNLLRGVRTFDVFTGKSIPENYKSVALSLHFRADEKTLTDAEIEPLMMQLRESAQRELGATLR